jgi:hypothetical protein
MGDVRWQPVCRRRRLVRHDGQAARQNPVQGFPLLGNIGLDDESRGRARRRLEERAAIGGHDAAEQLERAPQPE